MHLKTAYKIRSNIQSNAFVLSNGTSSVVCVPGDKPFDEPFDRN
jgi:hypothetical protein